jgi:hypothetical protein
MSNRVWLWCVVVMMLLTGCGSASKSTPAGSPGYPGGGSGYGTSADARPSQPSLSKQASPSADSAPSGGDFDAPPPAAAPPATASAERGASRPSPSPEPPRDRPGLGTEWGETRQSRVHDVSFARADADRPFAVANLFYNDRRGVDAQVSFHNGTASRRHDFSAANGAISVAIHDGSGDSLEAVHTGDRTYVVGQSGERYTIVLTNHTGHRFEAIATVDGLDVINGKTGTLSNRGYVLMPFATLEIDGFRQSTDAVAAFRFASVADSYAAQTGSARNVGVIGVAFFSERGDTFNDGWSNGELNRRDTANPFPGSDPRFARPPR